MKQFDVLYKRTKTGAIQYYKLEVLPLNDGAQIVKESGQLNTTNPIVHRESVTKGKNIGKANETTPAQQAISQAESDWKKKKDEGYKTIQDFGGEIQSDYTVLTTDEDNVTVKHSIEDFLQIYLPQFNTDASGNVKPMLAKAVDWKKVQYPCIVQPKLDGVRCLMIVNPSDTEIVFLSRSGKPYSTLKHIANHVHDYVVNHPQAESMETFILDGEIYSHEITFQQITAAVKKQSEHTPLLKFRAYDIVSDDIQVDRLRALIQLINNINSEHITLVEHTTCGDKEEVKAYHDNYVFAGYEGAMIRHKTGKYGQGQRSSDLLKVKEFDETEYTVIDFELGQREEDLIAVCQDVAGVFRAKMMGNAKYKKEIWQWWNTPMEQRTKNKFTNPQLTVNHFGRTDSGLPRFPVGKAIRDYE